MIFKPATPGFLTTLTATILLAVVSFSVPYFKSIYFLQATYNTNGIGGLINFGTLGYCLVVNGNSTCTKPSIGYEFDPNTLLGVGGQVLGQQIDIPIVVTKWITYALFLHVIAFGLAGVSAILGLLAHIREFSMTCFSSCISGLAASIALLAFIFDMVLFFLAKARIKSLNGATAVIGNAIWLTLAAWVLLFISGCMFGIGRCCIGNRPRAPRSGKVEEAYPGPPPVGAAPAGGAYAEQMRLEAIKAEMERKARQNTASTREGGLPAFEEYETRPLTADDEHGQHTPYQDHPAPGAGNRFGAAGAATGYVPSHAMPTTPQRQHSTASSLTSSGGQPNAAGVGAGRFGQQQSPGGLRQNTYNPAFPNSPSPPGPSTYPPQPLGIAQRQASLGERNIYENAGLGATAAVAGVAAGTAVASSRNDYLRPGPAPHPRADSYGHHTQGSSYHSAYSHQPYASQYGADYQQQQQQQQQPRQDAGYYPGMQQQAAYPAGAYDPYAAAATAQSTYPPASTDPYYGARQQSPHAQYNTQQSSYGNIPTTQSPPNATASPYAGGGAYSSQQQSPHVNDLNFPGVAVPVQSGPTSPVGGFNPQQHSGYGASPTPASPTRLYGLREEREPSSIGPAAGSSNRPLPGFPEESPPQYESSESPGGFRNEKAIYRP